MKHSSVASSLALSLTLSFTIMLVLLAGNALAQTWPSRPIKILVPIPPGGAPDITARVIGEKLGEAFNQPVIIENRTGSNGNIAAEIMLNSPPDGYTLLLCPDSQIVINPHVYEKMSFDPMKDLMHVVSVAANEFFLAANPDAPFKTFQEFIAYAKKANPPLAYASGGNGSQHHLSMEMLKVRAGISLVHIPFKGAAPATTATIAGEVPIEFAGSTAGPQIRSGKLRALAIAGSKRLAAFPDIPTIGEFYPGFANSIWLGLCAPRGLPAPVVARLRGEVNRILTLPDVREKFARSGALEPLITTQEEFAAMVKTDYDKYGKVVKAVGARVD